MRTKAGKHDRLILWIGALKVVKAILLLALSAAAFGLINDHLSEQLRDWIRQINADAHVRYLEQLLDKISSTNDRQYIFLGASLFIYAGLFFTEGIGLLLRRRWGEFLTVIITSSFLPLEVYEAVKKFTYVKLIVMALNVAIVIYLIWRLRHEKQKGS